MKNIRNLEIHLAHGCNLFCQGCSHYSNQGHKGVLSLAEAERWMGLWSRRLSPHTFSLLGGEPTLHHDLAGFVALARRHWPSARLRLVTNGFFLHRHPALPVVLQGDANACLYLSVHHDSPEYKKRLRPIRDLLKSWKRQYGIRVEVYSSFKNWTRRYHGSGSAMEPFKDGRWRQSWKQCPARNCPQLFEGSIWKCAPLAYLKLQDTKYGLSDSWKPYLHYQPLAAGCSDSQLDEFFCREEETFCGMCPADPEKIKLPMPLRPPNSRPAAGFQN
jgi:hypothetical protein